MYGCAITCSETSSSLGVSQAGFLSRSVLRAHGLLCRSCGIAVDFKSLILPPSIRTRTTDIKCQRFACACRDSSSIASRAGDHFRDRATRRDTPAKLRRGCLAQIGAYVRKRRRDLHPAVGQHQQRRGRFLDAPAQRLRQVEGNVAEFHRGFNCCLALEHCSELPVLVRASARACSRGAQRCRPASACRC